jgi:hypothetical protein
LDTQQTCIESGDKAVSNIKAEHVSRLTGYSFVFNAVVFNTAVFNTAVFNAVVFNTDSKINLKTPD